LAGDENVEGIVDAEAACAVAIIQGHGLVVEGSGRSALPVVGAIGAGHEDCLGGQFTHVHVAGLGFGANQRGGAGDNSRGGAGGGDGHDQIRLDPRPARIEVDGAVAAAVETENTDGHAVVAGGQQLGIVAARAVADAADDQDIVAIDHPVEAANRFDVGGIGRESGDPTVVEDGDVERNGSALFSNSQDVGSEKAGAVIDLDVWGVGGDAVFAVEQVADHGG